MTGPQSVTTATGVRIAGDHYQWVIAWAACVEVIRDRDSHMANPAIAVGVEVDDAGNLDDVVTYRCQAPHTFRQVKYAFDASTPVNQEYLTKPTAKNATSILRKLHLARLELLQKSGDAPLDLRLLTNRLPDPTDPLLQARDSRTGLLVPRGLRGGPRSKLGEARAAWATSIEVSENELIALLEDLHFDLGQDPQRVRERAQLLMLVTGLVDDQTAVRAGADWVASQVEAGVRRIEVSEIEKAVETLKLRAGPFRATLSVATLVPDPVADQAAHSIDWVDRFEGDDPYAKRHPQSPATWAQLQSDLEAMPRHLGGAKKIAITGSYRLAPAFMIGAACRMVMGLDVAAVQRGVLWSSEEQYEAIEAPLEQTIDVGQGEDLAVAIGVATTLFDDVHRFVMDRRLPVSSLLFLSPAAGAKDNSISGPAQANALSVGLRDAVRTVVSSKPGGYPRVHLFLATPGGLALLLGHRWNRIAPTVVYEDLNVLGYEAAFDVRA